MAGVSEAMAGVSEAMAGVSEATARRQDPAGIGRRR
jgi:hypothetical protein